MKSNPALSGRRGGFTLTEVMVVVGLVALLISLLMPAITKARAAAQSAACLSNLRQMGTAWTLYLVENKGRLPEYVWYTPTNPDVSWRSYWPGILDSYKVRGETLLCPTASEPMSFNQSQGYGNVVYAWTGKHQVMGTVLKLNPTTYREGSYGYNRYLRIGGGFGSGGKANKINAVRRSCDVPVFLDAIIADVEPAVAKELAPPAPPPNLRGDEVTNNSPEHWRFLIARHGRAINGFMADGSARRIPLDETYELTWNSEWQRCRLQLPAF